MQVRNKIFMNSKLNLFLFNCKDVARNVFTVVLLLFWLWSTFAQQTYNSKTKPVLKLIQNNSVQNSKLHRALQGEFVIAKDGSGDYTSIAAAISAIQSGITGAVIFKIKADSYDENVVLSNVSGTSETNTITFTSLSGNNDDVIITGNNFFGTPAVFTVEKTSYVTLENISIVTSGANYDSNLLVKDESRHFTLRNCIIQGIVITSGSTGKPLVNIGGGIDSDINRNCDYFTAEGNIVTGGFIGLQVNGPAYATQPKQTGAVIRNNALIDQWSKAIYVLYEQDVTVDGNIIIGSPNAGSFTLHMNQNSGNSIIKNNSVILNNTTVSGAYTGIYIQQTVATDALVYNNIVSITNNNASTTYGIAITTSSANVSFYYNSININGTDGRCFGVPSSGGTATTNTMPFKNNLLQNNSTNGNVCFIGTLTRFVFSNNAYYYKGSNFTNSHADFAAWVTASGDVNSFIEQAAFTSPTDLHLTEQGGLNAAIPVLYITTDADGKPRSATTPTIGAYEYEAVVIVKPELEEGYPKTGNITYNSIEFKTKWSQSGNLYGMIKEISEDAPTKSELLATTAVNINSETEYISTFTSLTEDTEYRAYFIFVSAFDVESDIVTTNIARTLKQILSLSVTLPEVWSTVSAGTEVNIEATVSGSVEPYVYEWRNKMNEVISTSSVLTVSPTVAQQYRLKVTGSDNQNKVCYTDVLVRGESVTATFEDNYLEPESYWQGRTGNDSDESIFYSGSYSFTNTYIPSWMTWGGFGYSNITATEFNPSQWNTHQFRSVVGHGADESNTFAVMCDMDGYYPVKIEVIHSQQPVTVSGVYLTNSAYTYNSMINGDAVAGAPFTQGDYYKVIFTGNTGTTVEYYLADYRSTNATEHYILTEWKWFDLTPLGNITNLTVSVDGSRKNVYGLLTPAYLCMDNLGVTEPLNEIAPSVPTNLISIYPNPFTDYIIINTVISGTATIYNLSGSMVLSKNISNGNNRIETSSLPQGVYMLKFEKVAVKIVK